MPIPTTDPRRAEVAMPVRLSCPFCNSAFTLPAVPADRKAPCPRCGETFVVKPANGEPAALLPFPRPSTNGETAGEFPPHADPPDVARPLLPLAGIGTVLALIIVGVVLAAVFYPNLPDDPRPPAEKDLATWPPAAVPGLAFLPPDTNVAAAIQPRALLNHARRTGRDPQQLLAEAGLPETIRESLDKLGLPPERVAYLVIGLTVTDDNPIPRGVAAVAVLPPIDEDTLLKAWKANRKADAPDRYRAELFGLPVDLTRPTNGVYVFATRPVDLDGLPGTVGRGSGHLAPDLREAMSKLSPASVAWVATGRGDWAGKPAVVIGSDLAGRPQLPGQIAGGSQAALGLSLEPNPNFTAFVRGETGTRQELRQRLSEALGTEVSEPEDGDWLTATINSDSPDHR